MIYFLSSLQLSHLDAQKKDNTIRMKLFLILKVAVCLFGLDTKSTEWGKDHKGYF